MSFRFKLFVSFVTELPVASPLTHGVLRRLNSWIEMLKDELALRGPAPLDFIPGCFIESDIKGPAIHKYRSLLEKSNTPFSPIQASAAPARRLWNFLVRQENVQDIFIRAVFGKKRSPTSATENGSVAPSVNNDITSGSGELTYYRLIAKQMLIIFPFSFVQLLMATQTTITLLCLNQFV